MSEENLLAAAEVGDVARIELLNKGGISIACKNEVIFGLDTFFLFNFHFFFFSLKTIFSKEIHVYFCLIESICPCKENPESVLAGTLISVIDTPCIRISSSAKILI